MCDLPVRTLQWTQKAPSTVSSEGRRVLVSCAQRSVRHTREQGALLPRKTRDGEAKDVHRAAHAPALLDTDAPITALTCGTIRILGNAWPKVNDFGRRNQSSASSTRNTGISRPTARSSGSSSRRHPRDAGTPRLANSRSTGGLSRPSISCATTRCVPLERTSSQSAPERRAFDHRLSRLSGAITYRRSPMATRSTDAVCHPAAAVWNRSDGTRVESSTLACRFFLRLTASSKVSMKDVIASMAYLNVSRKTG